MATDNRTDAERRYDAERDGSAYFKPQPAAEDADYDPWDDVLQVLVNGSPAPSRGPSRQRFGALADGTPIQGDLWHGERQGVVSAEPEGWRFCVDDAGYIAGSSTDEENSFDFDGVTLDQMRELAALVNAGLFDRLLAAAVAWGRGDDAPPDPDDPSTDLPLLPEEEAILDMLDPPRRA